MKKKISKTAKAAKKILKPVAPRQTKQDAKATKPLKAPKPVKAPKTSNGKSKPAKPVVALEGEVEPGALMLLPTDLNKAVDGISGAVSRRSTLPVLGNFLVAADYGKQRVRIAATNLSLAAWRFLPAKVGSEFAVALPLELLALSKKKNMNTSEPLTITLGDRQTAKLTQPISGFRATLNGIEASEFPLIREPGAAVPDAAFEFTRDQILRLIAQVCPFVEKDDSRPVLTAVCMNVHHGKGNERTVDFVTADGYRLAQVTMKVPVKIANENPKPKKETGVPSYAFSVLVMPDFLREAVKIASDDEPLVVEIHTTKGEQSMCANERGGVTCQLMSGTFPNTQRIIPDLETLKVLPIPLAETRRAVGTSSVVAASAMNTIIIERQGDGVLVSATSAEVGDNQNALPVKLDKRAPEDGFEIGLHSKYVDEAIRALTYAEDVPLELLVSVPSAPAVIAHDGFTMVIMPMNIAGRKKKDPQVKMQAVSTATPAPVPASKPKPKPKPEPKAEDEEDIAARAEVREIADSQVKQGDDAEDADAERPATPPRVYEVNCPDCNTALEVRDGNTAVCQCGAVVDDKGSVIFRNAEPVAA